MRRHEIFSVLGVLVFGLLSACSFENSPKRLPAYLSPPSGSANMMAAKHVIPPVDVRGALVVINDVGFPKSAPMLHTETQQQLGAYLGSEIQKLLPFSVSSMVAPGNIKADGDPAKFVQLAKDEQVPFLLVAVLSSSEWEVPDRLPLQGFSQPTGLRGGSLVGYRAENYARVELALLDGSTGHQIVTTDGQAWATLERLAVPLESNVYPVVRREQSQPPIYPKTEGDAFETLRYVASQDAIDQAVLHFKQAWNTKQVS